MYFKKTFGKYNYNNFVLISLIFKYLLCYFRYLYVERFEVEQFNPLSFVILLT